jgi:hypothetical protein
MNDMSQRSMNYRTQIISEAAHQVKPRMNPFGPDRSLPYDKAMNDPIATRTPC